MTEDVSCCVESDDGNLEIDFDKNFHDILSDYPDVLEFINKLKEHVKWQNKKICKLRNKLNTQVKFIIFYIKKI